MYDYSIIRDVILDNKYISEAEFEQNTMFNGQSYSRLIHCKLDVLKKWIPIVIGIPLNWELNLFDFYLIENIPFIPHIDTKGKLCLFDLEGLLIYPDFTGLLNQCILRAKELISDGILNKNKNDFIKEFDSYFGLLKDKLIAHVVLPVEKKHINIRFCEKGTKDNLKKNETYFASMNQNDFTTWGHSGTQKNGIYFYIKPCEYIFPPNIFDYKLDEFLNKLLDFVNLKSFKRLRNKCKDKLVLIFEIQQDEKTINSCGFIIEKPIFLLKDKVQLISFNKIIPLLIHRINVDYLSSRTSFSSNELSDKSVLLIGCGSIGGYVFHNLIKSGCKNITLVDDDIMKPENIFRHFLGVESSYSYKAKSLAHYAKNTLPDIEVKTILKKIENAITDCNLNFNDFDYIISAIGNHTINYWLNKYILENKILKTIFYIWNEPLDIGSHVIRINIKDKNDYRHIFSIVDNEILDLSSYVKSGQIFSKTHLGCNGTFIPYGSTLSVESSILLMDLLKRELIGKVKNNIIISKKGDDYYFNKAGFLVSNRYKTQKEKYLEVALCDLRKDDE